MLSLGIQGFIVAFMLSVVSATGPSSINLGTAGNFTILAKSGISTVPASAITGDIGVSPASGTAFTGFSFTMDSSNEFATSTQVTGKLFAAQFASPTPSQLTLAVLDMQAAFTDGFGRLFPNSLNLLSGGLTSQTLGPALYKWTSSVTVTTSLTFNGSSTDVWILQIQNDLTYASGANTILMGGALSRNIFWIVSGAVTLQSGSLLDGVILGATNAALVTGASVKGRILVQTAATLQVSTVKPV